jgi:hypothetical protein
MGNIMKTLFFSLILSIFFVYYGYSDETFEDNKKIEYTNLLYFKWTASYFPKTDLGVSIGFDIGFYEYDFRWIHYIGFEYQGQFNFIEWGKNYFRFTYRYTTNIILPMFSVGISTFYEITNNNFGIDPMV